MALAHVIETIRPEWSQQHIVRAITADDRPWRTVVLGSIRGAADPGIRHPNGLRYVNADYAGAPTPLPPNLAELRAAKRCDHGEITDRCPLCRRGIPA